MSIEHKSPIENQQEASLKQATSSDIQKVKKWQEGLKTISTITDILWAFDFTDEQEDIYSKTLKKLDKGQLSIVQKLDKATFQELLSKPELEIQQFLIQDQIDALEAKGFANFSGADRLKYAELSDSLIATENQKQEKQQKTIATKESKIEKNTKELATKNKNQEQMRLAQRQKIAELRGALLENPLIKWNKKLSEFKSLFDQIDKVDDTDDTWKRKVLDKIISKLKSPWTLEFIIKDLNPNDYDRFKTDLLAVEPELQSAFDRVEAGFADELAKVKLWTDNLDGVNTDDDVLVKTEWGFTIEAWKIDRKLSLEWSDYKLPSKLDSKYEDQVEDLHQQSNKELAPYNTELTTLSWVLNRIQILKTNGVRFDEAKTLIQQKHPETYNSLGLSWMTSYSDMMNSIQAHIAQVEQSKKKVTDKIKQKLKNISAQNKKEAQEKDRAIEEMLRFFNSIGLDDINQNTFTQIIATVNLSPANYGLQRPINLENGSLGFDYDFWDKSMSLLEKKAFIGFVNKMLWEDVINEEIANGTTTLHPEASNRIRKLNNNTIGFFLTNLNKQEA